MLVLMMTMLSAFAMDLNAPDEAFSEEGAEATAGSCTDSCGGQSEDGCWCDEWCAYNGDCCDDKSAVCDAEPEPVTSCAGSCGGESADGCWCDDSCALYGDCCDDKADVCDAYAVPVTLTDASGNADEVTLIDQGAHSAGNALDSSLQAWRNFLELLVVIGSVDIEALGMNGSYEGRLLDGSGNVADAGLEINHSGSTVEGVAVVLDNGLEIDAGALCGGTYTLPVALLYLDGQVDRTGWTATGTSTHVIHVGGWWNFEVDVDVDWTFTLDDDDLETLSGSVEVDLPLGCSDSTLRGRFTRTSLF